MNVNRACRQYRDTARVRCFNSEFGAYRASLARKLAEMGKSPAEIRAALRDVDKKSGERRRGR